MKVYGKHVLIIGMAKSGISAAKLCHRLGADVMLYDSKGKEQLCDVLQTLKSFPFTYMLNVFDMTCLTTTDLIIMSPGVPLDLPFIEEARALNIPIWSEIELAYRQCKVPIIAITGTNGKTTTATLVGQILATVYSKVHVVGNIGIPFSEIVLDIKKQDAIVLEVSSFQLETIETFTPHISALLNITPDHLDRHKTFKNYIHTKWKITKNQKLRDLCVLNYDDEQCYQLSHKICCRVIFFSRHKKLKKGVFISDGQIVSTYRGELEKIVDIDQLMLLGNHNVENVMAAAALSMALNVPIKKINLSIRAFKGVPHRIEYVTSLKGVVYYNDSKATNPSAAIKGIKAMVKRTILIGGGMDKGNSFIEWINAFDNKVKALIVFGETSNMIKQTCETLDFSPCIQVEGLKEAVYKAYQISERGDSVLLSPACASWDMFDSFEERGQLFKQYVFQLRE